MAVWTGVLIILLSIEKNVHNKYEKIALFILAVSIYTIAASQNIKPHQFSVKTEKEFNAHAQTTTLDNLGQHFWGRNKKNRCLLLSMLSCFI